MQLGESFHFALWALSHDKLKAFLTMLGVVIGSAAIVLVVTIASVGRTLVVSQVEGVGANLSYATLDQTGKVLPEDQLSRADLTAASSITGVTAAAGTYDIPTTFQAQGKTIHARLVGVTDQFQEIRKLTITAGRYFDPEDFSTRDKVCLVTDQVASESFGQVGDALGNQMRLGEFRCAVIGTFRETVPTFGQSEIQDETVLVPFPLIKVINGDDFFQVLYIQSATSGDVPRVTDEFRSLLKSRHRPDAHYSVENLAELLETARTVSVAMTGVLIAVALVTLTAAGIGIMNIMLVNVSQRTREIGIRMAIGARKSDIRLQFLLEAAFISLGGAIIGVILALVLIGTVASLGVAPLGISWIGVLVTLVFSTGFGVLFGYRPADHAARLTPIEALRSD